MPIIGRSVPKNQPSVKPFHGSAGNSELLKANIAAAASGSGEEDEEGDDIGPVEPARRGGLRLGDVHQLRATVVARLCPVSRSPTQTTSEVKTSSSTPKAAPTSQL